MNQPFIKQSLGSKKKAEGVAQRAQTSIPAYQHFLMTKGIKLGESLDNLPKTDKKSYISAYSLEQLIDPNYNNPYTIFCSSGTSAKERSYWLGTQAANRATPTHVRMLLESNFSINKKKTLAIMGGTLGGWNGADAMNWAFQSIAATVDYPFYSFSPGGNLEAILEIINKMQSLVEQIILYANCSKINLLYLKASQLNQELPVNKLRYLVAGERFPETVRESLQKKASVPDTEPFLFSIYGAADTGVIGVESKASIALRKILARNADLAHDLGFQRAIPNFFHASLLNTFFEIDEDCLCVTRWQAIPIIRYILEDKVILIDWKKIKEIILNSELTTSKDKHLLELLRKASDFLPNLIALGERHDKVLNLLGHKFSKAAIDQTLFCKELTSFLTGVWTAKIDNKDGINYMKLDLETHPNITLNPEINETIYHVIVDRFCLIKEDFKEGWQKFYSVTDKIPEKRIIRLNLLPYPSLSKEEEKQIKHKGIVT